MSGYQGGFEWFIQPVWRLITNGSMHRELDSAMGGGGNIGQLGYRDDDLRMSVRRAAEHSVRICR